MRNQKMNTVIMREAEREPECRCGCAPCEENTCELACLVQPNFYCGQILADADLTAFKLWAQNKFRLGRYRNGWGVICGLDVRLDPDNPGSVIITPGYALDCCGNDVVVCTPTSLDLTTWCHSEECLDPFQQEDRKKARAERQKTGSGFDLDALYTDAEPYDLFLQYKEQPADAQKVLGRSACSTRGDCAWSRTLEDFHVSVRRTVEIDPQLLPWARWQKRYEEGRQKFLYFLPPAGSGGNLTPDQLRGRFIDWVSQHPPERFGFVKEWIYGMEAGELEARFVEVIRWMWLDYWASLLNCECPTCTADAAGVPLARVWLAASQSERRPGCYVLNVDSTPPLRRVLQADPCWPAPPGCINLGQFALQPEQDVKKALADLGISMTDRVLTADAINDPLVLGSVIQCNLIFLCPGGEAMKKTAAIPTAQVPAPASAPAPAPAPAQAAAPASTTAPTPPVQGPEPRKPTPRVENFDEQGVLVITDLGWPWGRRVIGFCRPG